MNGFISGAVQAAGDDGLLAALEPARARFRGLIVERVLAFEEFRRGVEREGGAANALANIAGLAHKIAGVGATLGFASVGALAAAVERCVVDGHARCAAPHDIWIGVEPRLDALLDALEALLDA